LQVAKFEIHNSQISISQFAILNLQFDVAEKTQHTISTTLAPAVAQNILPPPYLDDIKIASDTLEYVVSFQPHQIAS
jgi:hypothetical protein